jgi:hypothetical protein
VYGRHLGSAPPDIFRGGLPGEVYVDSWFPWYVYKASFSADTGQTFRHVYVTEQNSYDVYSKFGSNQLLFMSDREPGVFYILHLNEVKDTDPAGWHLELCIEYYRDYGDTHVATYCHDVHKDYPRETCETVTDLTSEKPTENSVLLSWSAPESSLQVKGYRVFRNHHLLTKEVITETSYLDENIPTGNYQYNILVYYTSGCISEISNIVSESVVDESCEAVNDLTSEKTADNAVLLNWSKPESSLSVEEYKIYRNDEFLASNTNTTYLDENLPVGNYEYYVVTHYEMECVSDSSNHVKVEVELGIKENGTRRTEDVILYPNPTTGELTIDNKGINPLVIEIFDIYGRKLLEQKPTLTVLLSYDLTVLQPGIYFVRVSFESGSSVVKRVAVMR